MNRIVCNFSRHNVRVCVGGFFSLSLYSFIHLLGIVVNNEKMYVIISHYHYMNARNHHQLYTYHIDGPTKRTFTHAE